MNIIKQAINASLKNIRALIIKKALEQAELDEVDLVTEKVSKFVKAKGLADLTALLNQMTAIYTRLEEKGFTELELNDIRETIGMLKGAISEQEAPSQVNMFDAIMQMNDIRPSMLLESVLEGYDAIFNTQLEGVAGDIIGVANQYKEHMKRKPTTSGQPSNMVLIMLKTAIRRYSEENNKSNPDSNILNNLKRDIYSNLNQIKELYVGANGVRIVEELTKMVNDFVV